MRRTMLVTLGIIPRPLFHFLTSLTQKMGTMLVSFVSFFNEVATETRKLSSVGFIF
jgi:hypothetical protein